MPQEDEACEERIPAEIIMDLVDTEDLFSGYVQPQLPFPAAATMSLIRFSRAFVSAVIRLHRKDAHPKEFAQEASDTAAIHSLT